MDSLEDFISEYSLRKKRSYSQITYTLLLFKKNHLIQSWKPEELTK